MARGASARRRARSVPGGVALTVFAPLTASSERNLEALRRALRRGHGFQILLATDDGHARFELLRRLRLWSGHGGVPKLNELDANDLQSLLDGSGPEARTGAILDVDQVLRQARSELLRKLNTQRDLLHQTLQGPFVLMVSTEHLAELNRWALDFVDGRSGTWHFDSIRLEPTFTWRPEPFGDVAEARTAATRLRASESSATPPPEHARADEWLRLARIFSAAAEHSESEDAAGRALVLARQSNYFAAESNALESLAETRVLLHDLAEAENLYRQALNAALSPPLSRERARAHLGLARLEILKGDLEQARVRAQALVAEFHELQDPEGEGYALLVFGDAARRQGSVSLARDVFKRAQQAFAGTNNKLGEASAHLQLGQMAIPTDMLAAEHHTRRSLELSRTANAIQAEANALQQLATIAFLSRDPEQAHACFTKALALYLRADDRLGQANLLVLRGLTQAEVSDLLKAAELLELLNRRVELGHVHRALAAFATGSVEREQHLTDARNAWQAAGREDLIALLDTGVTAND